VEDFFAILVLISIVFNAINKMLQKGKGNRQPPPARVVRKTAEELAGELKEQLRYVRKKQPDFLTLPGPAEKEQSPERYSHSSAGRLQPELIEVGAAPKAAIGSELERMLVNPDSLVAAYIFHEILERPRALQGR